MSWFNTIGRLVFGDRWIPQASYHDNLCKIITPAHEWEQYLYQTYGNVYWRRDGFTHVLSVAEKEMVLKVLMRKASTVFTRRRDISCGNPWIDKVLSLTGQPDDTRIRNVVRPAFRSPFPKADMIIPIATEVSTMLTGIIPDLEEVVGTYIIEVITKTLFTYEVRPEDMPEFLNHVRSFLAEGASWREFINIYIPPVIRRFLPNWPVFNDSSINFFRDFAIDAEDERNELLNNLAHDADRPDDLLQLLLDARAEERIDYDEFVAQFLMIFIAGYDTNSSVIRCALAYLAFHTEMQERLYRDLNAVGEEINTFRDISRVAYLDAVIHESLRMCPGAVTFERTPAKNYTFEERSHPKVKKGYVVSIPVYCINHDPARFHDPEEFIPDRFLVEVEGRFQFRKPGPPAINLPFGLGPRSCVGQSLALALIKIFLATVVKKLEFSLPFGVQPPFGYEEKQGQLKFKNIPVVFTPRAQNQRPEQIQMEENQREGQNPRNPNQ